MIRHEANRVVLTNFYGDMGGGEFALLRHAEWLISEGRRVYVLLFKDGPFAKRLRTCGCEVSLIGVSLACGSRGRYLAAARVVPRLAWRLLCLSPQYVLSYTLQELPFVVTAGRLARTPVLFRDQGRPREDAKPMDWRERLLPKLSQHMAGVVATTKGRAAYLKELGLAGKKVQHVYLGVPSGSTHADGSDEVRREWGIPARAPLLAMVGRLIALKGHRTLLSALTESGCEAAHVLIVGGTQLNDMHGERYCEELRELINSLGIADRVHFTGFRSDVRRLMGACDVICSASEWETFGLTLVEAMMCAKPVVATAVSGPREIVVEGRTGFLFPVGDAGAMARCVATLIADPGLARQMGEAGQRRARELFDLEQSHRLLDEAIESYL